MQFYSNQLAGRLGRLGGGAVAWAVCLAASLGCWEEIHYAPSPADSTPPSNDNAAAEPESNEPPNGDVTITPETPPAAEAQPEAPPQQPPLADDLFSADSSQEAPAPPGESASPGPPGVDAPDIPAAESILPTPADPPSAADAAGSGAPSAEEPVEASPPSAQERLLAWQAASQWSLAAAIYAKGLAGAPHAPILQQATAAAGELGLELPAFPTTARPEDREAAVIEGLRGELAVALSNAYSDRLGAAESAAADLAVRSHLLLLVYSPRNADATMEAQSLKRAGEGSGLPAEIWQPLSSLVEQRAAFLDVRQAVFDLHRRAEAHLSRAQSRRE